MNALVRIAGVLLLSDLIWLGYLLVCRAVDSSQPSPLTEFTPWIVGVGVLVAIITLVSNMRRQQSEDYLKNAVDLLEKAHTVLAQLDEKNRPKNIRINWLSAARLLKTSDNISKHIIEASHKAIYQGHREYWRMRFRDLINPSGDGFPEDYFSASAKAFTDWGEEDREPLAETSLAVLYRFISWPDGIQDPIEHEPKFTDKQIKDMKVLGPQALGTLLIKARELETQKPRED